MSVLPRDPGPIGVFDSGYGGLTILEGIRRRMPQHDYVYLGDNARAPYGPRSFDVVYEYTRQAVIRLFEMGCHLVILGCNTASAKALRSIQQNDLPHIDPDRRILGIIIPTAEVVGQLTRTRHVGILATDGTIRSQSYEIEIAKRYPEIKVTGMACPMWVPLVENNEVNTQGADFFVRKDIEKLMEKDRYIDTIILGCTHYPILLHMIEKHLKPGVKAVCQGDYVAESLASYLQRHPEMEERCSKGGHVRYLTTESAEKFSERARLFLREHVCAEHVDLGS